MAGNVSARPFSAPVEKLLGGMLPVLDHGFVRVIDYMGDDAAIVQAARVSYGAGTKTVNEDAGLIDYLMRNRHTSPFEMCEIKLHVKMPIFVARQWVRHRTANLNEYSLRYSEAKDEVYLPLADKLAKQGKANKQGSGEPLSPSEATGVQALIEETGKEAHDTYRQLLDVYGLARETARTVLPLGTYTEFYWKIDLHNLLHFVSLRADKHAQDAIRDYADVIWRIVQEWVPLTAAAFRMHVLEAVHLSASEVSALRLMITATRPMGGLDLKPDTIAKFLKLGLKP